MATQASANIVFKGIVKQVLSGDAVVIRGKPQGGPPPERQLNFSGVTAPRLARRPMSSSQQENDDEPFAWESREFLRKKLIGKEVIFVVETIVEASKREYGTVYLGKDVESGENITHTMISEGLLSVREGGLRDSESRLSELENQAKEAKKGKWSDSSEKRVRTINWNIENPKAFLAKFKGKKIPAVIEHVRDGSTIRAFLLPHFHYVTLMISGIKNGNIAENLLKEGFAKCVDWSMMTVTGGPEKLRASEKIAKENKLKIWLDYKPSGLQVSQKEISGRVVEIVNADGLMIKTAEGNLKKVFLAGIRAPRASDTDVSRKALSNRSLYDIPWLFEAREFLRQKLIGQKISLTVDYIQPAQNNFPEKVCCTLCMGDVNIAESVVHQGLATAVRYRQDDDQRPSSYDDLLSAEAHAVKNNVGLHNKKDIPIHRVAVITNDVNKAKNFLPFLQRAKQTEAVVEFVASGSRMRLYVPRETCLITFLLSGISCPKPSRPGPKGTGTIAGDEYGSEALAFSKDLVMHREVVIEVESMDKGGNFIGWLHIGGKNLSTLLVKEGLSSVHATAEASHFYSELTESENYAKENKLNIWENFVEEVKVPDEVQEMSSVRTLDYCSMVVSELTRHGYLYGQFSADAKALEDMTDKLQKEFSMRSAKGDYQPKKGEICAALFSEDRQWYRAKVEKAVGDSVSLFYIDYGNRESTRSSACSRLPAGLANSPGYAHEMALAFVKIHKTDEDYRSDAINAIKTEVMDREVLVNKEYKNGGIDYVTMQVAETKQDLGKILLLQGLAFIDFRKERKFQQLLTDYKLAQEEAKKQHLNIWRYGDVTDDDAHEFGMERKL